MALNKEEIASRSKKRPKVVTVQVPEWDGEVCLRRLAPRVFYDLVTDQKRDVLDRNLRFLAAAMCDQDGTPLYEDLDEGAAVLTDESGGLLDRLLVECNTLQGIGAEAKKKSEANGAGSSTS